MEAKYFLLSIFSVVFYTLNCMGAIKIVDTCLDIDYSSHHDLASHRLDLSNLGITEESLEDMFVDLLCFINNNKVEFLLLDKNNFTECDFELLKKVACLLTSSTTLKSISLKNNFRHASIPERGFSLSAQALAQITSTIGQIQSLFKDSLDAAGQQTNTEYITKEILLDDIPPLSIIQEIKLPLTGCQKFKAFAVRFSERFAYIIASSGLTVLSIYLSGKFECNC